MDVIETAIDGCKLIKTSKHQDERGIFYRSYCDQALKPFGIADNFTQDNISVNPVLGTLRGIHYSAESHKESKIVRCVSGSVFDVIVDLRPASPTFKQHFTISLDAETLVALYIAPGVAHGFLTTSSDTIVLYKMGNHYNKEQDLGIRWNDSAFGINWPFYPKLISVKDSNFKNFEEK